MVGITTMVCADQLRATGMLVHWLRCLVSRRASSNAFEHFAKVHSVQLSPGVYSICFSLPTATEQALAKVWCAGMRQLCLRLHYQYNMRLTPLKR